MKRLEEIKNEVAEEHGYNSYKDVVDLLEIPFLMIDEIIKLYAREVAQASLDKAAKQAKTSDNCKVWNCEGQSVNIETIVNPDNIVLL